MNGPATYIGVDPGVGGGLAAISSLGVVLAAIRMPETEREIIDFFSAAVSASMREDGVEQARAVLERVSASPQMGVVSAFTFGRGVGVLRTALVAAGVPFDEVTPRRWQSGVSVIYTKGATDVEKKNITKRRAQDLFPGIKVTHAIADALLIAEFCRRTSVGAMHNKAAGF